MSLDTHSQAEAERHFAAHAARCGPGRTSKILACAGQGNPPASANELPGLAP